MLAIASEKDRISIYKTIVKAAANLLHARGAGIDELDEIRHELIVVAPHNMPPPIVGMRFPVGKGLSGLIIENNLPHHSVPDYQNWAGRVTIFDELNIFESLFGVPLKWLDKPMGVLWVTDFPGRKFTQGEIDLLKGLARLASIALKQNDLRNEAHDKAKRLEDLAAAVNNILSHVTKSNRKERLNAVAEYAAKVTGAETCGILLVEEPDWLTLRASYGHREGGFEEGKKLRIEDGEHTGLSGFIAYHKKVFRAHGETLRNHPAVKERTPGSDYSPSGECFSLLAIPMMKDDGELRGLIRITNKKDVDDKPNSVTQFSKLDELIGEGFAKAALLVIETADLLDEVKNAESRYQAVLEASNILALAKDPEKGLASLAEMVLRVTDGSFCRILLYDEDEESLQVMAAEKASGPKGKFNWNPQLGEKTNVNKWQIINQAFHSGESALLKFSDDQARPNLQQLARWLELEEESGLLLEIRSMLSLPLKVSDHQIIGLLNIGELQTETDYTDAEGRYADAISTQVALLIERIQRDNRLLRNLFETEREIATAESSERALKLIAAQVFDVARAYGRKVNAVSINVKEGNLVRVVAVHPPDRLPMIQSVVDDEFDLSKGKNERIGIVGRVLKTGNLVNIGRVEDDPDYIRIHEDTKSQLVVPISQGSETIGAINAEASEYDAFDTRDVMLVQGLADQTSSAISREEQFRERKKMRALALIGATRKGFRHVFGQKIGFMLENLKAAAQSSDIDEIRHKIETVIRNANALNELRFARGDKISEEPLNDLIQRRIVRARETFRGLRVIPNLSATEFARVQVNKDWFEEYIVGALLTNACEAAVQANHQPVEITTEIISPLKCAVKVKNMGGPIEPNTWNKLGNEPIPWKDGDTERGDGVFVADFALTLYGGKLTKLKNEKDNVVIGIELPMQL
jgi:GAF domain-containing protein